MHPPRCRRPLNPTRSAECPKRPPEDQGEPLAQPPLGSTGRPAQGRAEGHSLPRCQHQERRARLTAGRAELTRPPRGLPLPRGPADKAQAHKAGPAAPGRAPRRPRVAPSDLFDFAGPLDQLVPLGDGAAIASHLAPRSAALPGPLPTPVGYALPAEGRTSGAPRERHSCSIANSRLGAWLPALGRVWRASPSGRGQRGAERTTARRGVRRAPTRGRGPARQPPPLPRPRLRRPRHGGAGVPPSFVRDTTTTPPPPDTQFGGFMAKSGVPESGRAGRG